MSPPRDLKLSLPMGVGATFDSSWATLGPSKNQPNEKSTKLPSRDTKMINKWIQPKIQTHLRKRRPEHWRAVVAMKVAVALAPVVVAVLTVVAVVTAAPTHHRTPVFASLPPCTQNQISYPRGSSKRTNSSSGDGPSSTGKVCDHTTFGTRQELALWH